MNSASFLELGKPVMYKQTLTKYIILTIFTLLPTATLAQSDELKLMTDNTPAIVYIHVMTTKGVLPAEHVIALGFPEDGDLTPSFFRISNLSSPHGYYKADGNLQHGDSGAPVFNKKGQVIAMVEGGTEAGTRNDDLIPIGRAISLVKKWDVKAGIDGPAYCWNSPPQPPDNLDWLLGKWSGVQTESCDIHERMLTVTKKGSKVAGKLINNFRDDPNSRRTDDSGRPYGCVPPPPDQIGDYDVEFSATSSSTSNATLICVVGTNCDPGKTTINISKESDKQILLNFGVEGEFRLQKTGD
jgi:hypothetical protein